jgi:hypothetical protein
VKLIHAAVLVSLFVGGFAQGQTREDQAVARACRADAQKMCAGKTGQELQQCLKSNQAQLSSNCKEAVSKLPQQPKT